MPDALEVYGRGFARGIRPEPDLTVSAWADQHRVLSTRASSEPGPWRTDRTPYLREIMDALSPSSPIERVVLMAGTQLGKTEVGLNWIGYIMHHAPGPVLAVQPTVEMAKRFSRQRVEPLIEEAEVLRGLVKPARSRDSGNTLLSKEFTGGLLIMTGANSAVGLRSMPVRFLFLDEIDAYPADVDDEGDPVTLAIRRTSNFARRKILMVSTPTIAGLSRIEGAYGASDQRRYLVPCPECGHEQALAWKQVRWPEGRPEEAAYACEGCGALIPEYKKPEMLARGRWVATAPGDGKTAGFHLPGLYSPWSTWSEAAREWTDAQRSTSRLKTFVNTALAECWQDRGDAPDWHRLWERREPYPLGVVLDGGVFLTAGVDVQRDRLELEVVAWGRRRISWSVDYRVLQGDPSQPQVWQDLADLINQPWFTASGAALRIAMTAIDSGGLNTQDVYRFVASRDPQRVMAIKGVASASVAVGRSTPVDYTTGNRRYRRGAQVWPIGVNLLKGQLYSWLKLDAPVEDAPTSDGFCHFPAHPPEFFKQITAERLVTRQVRGGAPRHEWVLTRERNEALDCRVYSMAAAIAAGIDRITEQQWTEAEARLGMPAQPSPALPASKQRQTIRSRFMDD